MKLKIFTNLLKKIFTNNEMKLKKKKKRKTIFFNSSNSSSSYFPNNLVVFQNKQKPKKIQNMTYYKMIFSQIKSTTNTIH